MECARSRPTRSWQSIRPPAGDCFVGVLAAALDRGADLTAALDRATAARRVVLHAAWQPGQHSHRPRKPTLFIAPGL